MKTVAIVGRAKETRDFAPFHSEAVDIWAFNDYALSLPRVTGLFEVHPDALTADRYGQAYKDWLRQPHPFPVWVHPDTDTSGIPAAQLYPLELIAETFGGNIWRGETEIREFLTSSPAYALALALLFGYERIEIYGIEMNPLEGYSHQANCWYFWMGQASARGVDIYVHPASRLFSDPLYPPRR